MQGPQAVLRQAGCNLLVGVRQAVVDRANPRTEPASFAPFGSDRVNTLHPGRCRPAKAYDGVDSRGGEDREGVCLPPSERSEAERRRTAVAQRRRHKKKLPQLHTLGKLDQSESHLPTRTESIYSRVNASALL